MSAGSGSTTGRPISARARTTQPRVPFSPLALSDIEVAVEGNGEARQVRVAFQGVALFDRKRRTTEHGVAG